MPRVSISGIARSGLNSLPGVQVGPPEGELPSASAPRTRA